MLLTVTVNVSAIAPGAEGRVAKGSPVVSSIFIKDATRYDASSFPFLETALVKVALLKSALLKRADIESV